MTSVQDAAPARRPWLVYLPLAGFALVAGLFLAALFGGDHSRLPSPLIGKPAPSFSLPSLDDGPNITDADLRQGHVTLINIFASWCPPCRDEHPVLLRLSKDPAMKAAGVALIGFANKDQPADSRKFLTQNGNPYARVALDLSGRTGIDWGVYGAPETFVVRGDGTIAYKFIGPLSDEAVRDTLAIEIEKARK